jgi:hypothetical protein
MQPGMKKKGTKNGSSKSPNVSGQISNAGKILDAGGRRRRRAAAAAPRQASSNMTTRKEKSPMPEELTYQQAALMFHVTPRHMRRICRKHKIDPIVRGHRTVRLPADKISKLHVKLVLSGGAR